MVQEIKETINFFIQSDPTLKIDFKVWYGEKEGDCVSDILFVLSKRLEISPQEAMDLKFPFWGGYKNLKDILESYWFFDKVEEKNGFLNMYFSEELLHTSLDFINRNISECPINMPIRILQILRPQGKYQ